MFFRLQNYFIPEVPVHKVVLDSWFPLIKTSDGKRLFTDSQEEILRPRLLITERKSPSYFTLFLISLNRSVGGYYWLFIPLESVNRVLRKKCRNQPNEIHALSYYLIRYNSFWTAQLEGTLWINKSSLVKEAQWGTELPTSSYVTTDLGHWAIQHLWPFFLWRVSFLPSTSLPLVF